MARINIEECWWSDPRRSCLIKLLGDEDRADGVAVRMWRLAQEFWGRGCQLVPMHVWATVEANAKLIQANLAEEREGGIYVRGSSQYLDWVAERRRAASAGGKKSAEKRGKKPEKAQANAKQTQANVELAKQTQPSGSGSGSDSDSSTKNISYEMVPAPAVTVNPVGVYVSAYREKYGVRPEVGPREGKILQTFARNHPGRWEELIRGYLEMPDSWAVARSHPVEVLVAKVNEIGRFLGTGKVVTKTLAREFDEKVTDEMSPSPSMAQILAEKNGLTVAK